MPLFTGVVPPVVTPLNPDFSVDFPSFTRVLENLLNGGVHGLFVLGSTSEVVFHDETARQAIVDHAVKVNNGRVPLFVGVIDPTTDRVINHSRIAKAAGADAIVVTAPFYARTSQPEIIDHFRYIRDAVDIPIIAYDIPVCVHVKLERKTTVTMAREGIVAGLKDSSGDDGNLRYVLQDMASDRGFFGMTGSEIMVDTALSMGAHGVVPGLANVDPRGYVKLWNLLQAGDHKAARAEQERLLKLFEIVTISLGRTSAGSAGVGAFKSAMRSLGIIASHTMARPQRTLNDEEAAKIDTILRDVGLFG
ncbi:MULTISPECIES: dihydrodipicolinate synthase family protein [unclassified Mesorhizobium]|uniref:dihydrodipicolinate synthase family protein n=1 Tax=unclassified Mesorhizobium TaxID=325217 RepID=UPI00241783BD|nr:MULTISPECIES: dihydrodipicolinate synthase family protein [unclassified Mesorhizobium]WFP65542.1 dihydrodipicolinate synthase family protein [Mesorhizobium sp. WSM4904]WFP78805.1 dihydrodipicolinate synthase family protein [Mesorhizobium sp. WSM4906]